MKYSSSSSSILPQGGDPSLKAEEYWQCWFRSFPVRWWWKDFPKKNYQVERGIDNGVNVGYVEADLGMSEISTVLDAHHKQGKVFLSNLCKTKSEQHQHQPHVQGTSWPPPIPSSSARRSPRRGDPRRSGRSPWWLRASSPAVKNIIILKLVLLPYKWRLWRMLLTHPDQSFLLHPRQISLQLAGWGTVLPIDIAYRCNIGGIQFQSIQFNFIKRIFFRSTSPSNIQISFIIHPDIPFPIKVINLSRRFQTCNSIPGRVAKCHRYGRYICVK